MHRIHVLRFVYSRNTKFAQMFLRAKTRLIIPQEHRSPLGYWSHSLDYLI